MNKNLILNTAVKAAQKAGNYLQKEFKDFDRSLVRLKSHHEIVSRADLNSEEIIIKEIRKAFPSHRIISEERGAIDNTGEFIWIIDPLDGSTNFSMHSPLWAVSIGIGRTMDHGLTEMVGAVIHSPMLGETYTASVGSGAFMGKARIAVSDVNSGKILNTFCHGKTDRDIKLAIKYFSKQKLTGLDCRQLGSAALELAYVAAGRIESIMIPGACLWDVAAGALIVSEAGGRVTDFKGKPWIAADGDILASNGLVHKDLLKVIGGLR